MPMTASSCTVHTHKYHHIIIIIIIIIIVLLRLIWK